MNFSSFTRQSDASRSFYQGALDILPLSIAVLPWGILAGSMAVNAGLSIWQSIAMSAVVFAGAAQLVGLGLVMAGASIFTIIITVFFITSQHFIYALKFRPEVMHYSFFKRLLIGFLLTDELFAVAVTRQNKLTFAYMFGAGLCFYLAWCFFSLLGIILAHSISDLQKLHLDFSIVAVFILLIIPMIKNRACLFGVLVSICSALIFKYFHIEAGTVLSGVLGMFCAVLFATQTSRQEQKA